MKHSELKKLLIQTDCHMVRHGSSHDIWLSPKTGKKNYPSLSDRFPQQEQL